MCRTSTPDTKICDQCRRHNLECVFVEHKRGRKLGSRNKRIGASGDSGSPPALVTGSSYVPYSIASQPVLGVNGIEQPSGSRQLPADVNNSTTTAQSGNGQTGISYPPPSFQPLVPSSYSPAAIETALQVPSAHRSLPEQSPLALLARTAEAQSNNSR